MLSPTLDVGLSQKYKILLNNYRLLFFTEINVHLVLDYLCVFSNFQLDTKNTILSLSSNKERIAALLDHLELLDDNIFLTFLSALREQNEQLYKILFDALLTFDQLNVM